jgi:hypothetical protein
VVQGRERAYRELAARRDRAGKLKEAAAEVQLQRQLLVCRPHPHPSRSALSQTNPGQQGKGQRRKVGTDARGLPVYKWAQERKR